MDTVDQCSSSSAVLSPSSSHRGPSHKLKAGRRKFKETRHPVDRGARGHSGHKLICELAEPHKNSRLWLGTSAAPEIASRADDVTAIALHSCCAPLNCPESALALARPRFVSPVDIRIAVAEADEMSQESLEQREGPKSKTVFVDEEVMFNMPELMDEMAAGMLVTPLAMQRGFDWDGAESYLDFSLWSD